MADSRERERRGRADYGEASRNASAGGATSVRLPEGTEWYESDEGAHDVDFMPFLATDKKEFSNPDAKAGFEICFRKYTIHRVPGMDGKARPYCCLDEVFGEVCPVCKAAASGRFSEKVQESLRKQTRRLWLVNDRPGDLKNLPGTKNNPWKVIDQVHWNRKRGFGEMMFKEWDLNPKYRDMDRLDAGYTVRLRYEKSPNGRGGTWNECMRIDFTKREYSYPDDLINSAPCLDECLVKPDPDELERLLVSGPLGQETVDEEPGAGRPRRPAEEDRAPAKAGNGREAPPRRPRDEEETPAPAKKKPAPRDEEEGEAPPPRKPAPRREEDDVPVRRPAAKGGEPLKVGALVMYELDGEELELEVNKILPDGTLNLEDQDGKVYKGVDPADVRRWKGTDTRASGASATAKEVVRKVAPARDEDDDLVDEDDEPRPPPAKKKPVVRDEDDDDPLEDDDERPARTSRR